MFNRLTLSRATKWGLLASMLAVFALFSGIYLPGCSNNPNNSTQVNAPEEEFSFFDDSFDDAALAKAVIDPAINVDFLTAEEYLSAEDGGSIVIGTIGTYYEFYVPPDAVPYDVAISVQITRLEKKYSKEVAVVYDFSPDGLVFAQPATLRMDVTKVLGKKATEANLYYYNEQTKSWEHKGTYPAGADGWVSMPIEHFSRWGAD
ncbi:MAG: hypothetical protein JSU65_06030 [Candidatus Zixiibacteriota bacterium]|nr:MAG: hypothetical protein JSU65_06030 [candidate division Zixibacteria bacterium]